MAADNKDRIGIIVDLWSPSSDAETCWEFLDKVARNIEDLKGTETKVVVILDQNMHRYYTEYINCHGEINLKGSMVTENNKVHAVYKAKRLIDEENILDIHVLMCQTRDNEWTNLRNEIFSPVYNITVIPVGDFLSTSDLLGEVQIRQDFQEFLTLLPSIGDLEIIRSQKIPGDIFVHGWTTRLGGISYSPGLSSLNLLYTRRKVDSHHVIRENRRRLAEQVSVDMLNDPATIPGAQDSESDLGFDPDTFYTIVADHGVTVWVIGTPKPDVYDAIVTNKPGLTLAAPGADCIPLLFADPKQKCIGVAHAGWRGTINGIGIAMATVNAMVTNFHCQKEDILVGMGPGIRDCCFCLSEDDCQDFACISERVVTKSKSKWFVNLHKTNRLRLEHGGIPADHIDDTACPECTCCTNNKYFSFQRQGVPFGNQVGFINIKL